MTATKWRPPQHVRAIAIGIVRRGDEILAMRVRDDAGATKGWRPLGGAIELGERGAEAVTREFREELGLELKDVLFRAVLENIYEHEGARGHELVMVFDATFAEATAYARDDFAFSDGGVDLEVAWVTPEEADVQLFPNGLAELLRN